MSAVNVWSSGIACSNGLRVVYDSYYLVVRVCPASAGVFRSHWTHQIMVPGLPRERGGFPYRTPEQELGGGVGAQHSGRVRHVSSVWPVEQDGVDAWELGPEEIAERDFHHSRSRL